MADVFLSYARPDAAVAERLARELEKSGVPVWFDRELPAHRAYSDVIAAELESAPAVLVLWSKVSVNSQWVRSEANRARELGKLVQARLDNARLPMPFDQIQCGDLAKWRGAPENAGWKQIRGSIDSLLGVDAAPRQIEPTSSRRGLLIGGGATALAAAAGGCWFFRRQRSTHQPSPEAALLLQKGIDMLQNNDVFAADNPGSLRDAAALLSEATEADPRSSDAWGSLALAYAALTRVSPPAERPGLAQRSRSAAARALQIKSREPRAIGSLLLLQPLYRHWITAERADRQALDSTPTPVPLLLFIMSEMLRSVGRCKEAAATSTKFDRKAFIIPGADEQVLVDLWSAGDLQGADEAQRLAVEHWPQHPEVWTTRFNYLMYSGRASEALGLLQDQAARPANITRDQMEVMEATAKALSGEGRAREAIALNLDHLRADARAVFPVVHACAALGDLPTGFAILQGYYFAEGPWAGVAPAGGDEDRKTDDLFGPPMRSAWHDTRFAQLVRRIGLEDYWHRSAVVPDFRRYGAEM